MPRTASLRGRACQGDSGGGVFRGRLNDNGDLLAITSLNLDHIFGDSDGPANVARVKE